MHYHIIGTDHFCQLSDYMDKGLSTIIEKYMKINPNVILIAEEVCADDGDVCTFGKKLIGADKWLSIDMTDAERKVAGIYDLLTKPPVYFDMKLRKPAERNIYYYYSEAKREIYWLNKIEAWCSERGLSEGTVIVTCGINHLEYLQEKAEARSHTVTTD